jgi:hypothetical protein
MKDKPPPDSITRTAELMTKLLAVPKADLETTERKWKLAKRARAMRAKA